MAAVHLVVDANVLIDYATADESVLGLVVRYIGPVYVPRDVLDEAHRVDEDMCIRLGLQIAEGSLDQLLQAGVGGGGLSFQDRMCLILARDHGWVCVSNDRRLRRACEEVGVETRWGLQLMLEVVAAGGLDPESAVSVAETIGRRNAWLGAAVVEAFTRKVRGLP